jgi:chromosome segregation ATPase
MSSEDFEHQMDFILKQQSVFSSEMIELKQSIVELKEAQKQQGENLDKLTSIVGSVVEEMRDSSNKLIVASETTRDLANKVASLEVQTSQRVTGLEHRVTDLEQKR